MFLLRLATEVDYNAGEEKFIQQVADEISFYYARYVDLLTLQAQAIDYGATSSSSSKPNVNGATEESKSGGGICEGVPSTDKAEIEKTIDEFKFVLEHEILPDMKRNFSVRKRFALFDDLTFSMITCTENLYKVFERC